MRKRYTAEQREQLLAEVGSSSETVRVVAERLGISASAAYLWVKQARAEAKSEAPVFARVVPERVHQGIVVEVGSATIRVEGEDREFLLVDWLTELLRVLELHGVVLSEFDVTIEEGKLDAVVRGEALDPAGHRLGHEVKAVTYHALEVVETKEGWEAYVVLDL